MSFLWTKNAHSKQQNKNPYLHVQNQSSYLILLIVYNLEYKIEQFRRLESLQIVV